MSFLFMAINCELLPDQQFNTPMEHLYSQTPNLVPRMIDLYYTNYRVAELNLYSSGPFFDSVNMSIRSLITCFIC